MLLFWFLNLLLCLPFSLPSKLPKEKLTTQVIVMSFVSVEVNELLKNDRNVICLVILISDGHERQCLSVNQRAMVRCLYSLR